MKITDMKLPDIIRLDEKWYPLNKVNTPAAKYFAPTNEEGEARVLEAPVLRTPDNNGGGNYKAVGLHAELPASSISDGYHTFKELYEFRKMYNAVLFNEWARECLPGLPKTKEIEAKYHVHKSWRHHDGELCFGGGWFIVVALLPTGQISNHYKTEDWNLFQVPETEKALFEYDGHTGADVLARLKALI
jgi:hypothetical protein